MTLRAANNEAMYEINYCSNDDPKAARMDVAGRKRLRRNFICSSYS